jgi:hypothetical protein
MTAREVDDAAEQLRELRRHSVEDLVLAGAASGLAVTASRLWPSLALPLLVGAIAVAFLGLCAYVRRFLLVEDLALDGDAYCIRAVREFGLRAASPRHRRELASTLRTVLTETTCGRADRLRGVRPEIERLIADLEQDDVHWEPRAAVALERCMYDAQGSLRDLSVPVSELRTRLRSILAEVEGPAEEQ